MKKHTISNEAMLQIIAIANYVLENEERHYEEIIDTCGADSLAAQSHVYRITTHLLGEIVDNPVQA
jgi:hypothetical protein